MNTLHQLLDTFVTSNKEHGFKRLQESELFFNVDYEVMEQRRNEFVKVYDKYVTELKKICGQPVAEDVSAHTFNDFELTKNEQLADMLTLFTYRECRFGILLWQEDKELPIEVCLSAYNPKGKQSPKKRKKKEENVKVGHFVFLGKSHPLMSQDFRYSKISFDGKEIRFSLTGESKLFGYQLSSENIWYGHFDPEKNIEKALELFIKGIYEFNIYPCEKEFDHSDQRITDYLATGRAPIDKGLPLIGEDYDNWVREKFSERYPNSDFTVKSIDEYSFTIVKGPETQTLTNGRALSQWLVDFKIAITLQSKQVEEPFAINAKIPFEYYAPFEETKVPDIEASFIASVIDAKAHRLDHKIKTITKCLAKGVAIPEVFDDGRKAIFHLIDSIHYIPETLREEDIAYLTLVLDHIPKSQLDAIDQETGLDATSYCKQYKRSVFSDFFENYKKENGLK
ncbi:hypothetical protein MHTCC0001_31820 [Flavobacteriaceae bacterium MHTCC 0001]